MDYGKLAFDGSLDRYVVRTDDGREEEMYYGDRISILKDGQWHNVRIEYDHSDGGFWYFAATADEELTPNAASLHGWPVAIKPLSYHAEAEFAAMAAEEIGG